MEARMMDEAKKMEEAKLTSAAAFVEGGIQEACDDACSICLEDFCESNPSTVTGCKHEFHLQCVLEWCQRSSQCPMCWQAISLKDPAGQELLDAVVQERNIRLTPPSRNAAIFHHPTLGDFEIQHLPVGVNDAELEERIIQHLAAAAAMGRARHFSRREGQRSRASNQSRPHFLVFSAQRDGNAGPASSASPERGENEPNIAMIGGSPSPPLASGEHSVNSATSPNQSSQSYLVSASGTSQHGTPRRSRSSPSQASPRSQDKGGPSDLQSFSDALKSRFNSVSMRYKESISKSTRGWKERWFSRNSPVADPGSHDNREGNTGITTVSRMMEHLETEDRATSSNFTASSSVVNPSSGSNEQHALETCSDTIDNNMSDAGWSGGNHLSETRLDTPCAAPSGSN